MGVVNCLWKWGRGSQLKTWSLISISLCPCTFHCLSTCTLFLSTCPLVFSFVRSVHLLCILQLECRLDFLAVQNCTKLSFSLAVSFSCWEARPHPWKMLFMIHRTSASFFFPSFSSSMNMRFLLRFCGIFVSPDTNRSVLYQFYYSPHLISLLFCNPWPISLPLNCSFPASKVLSRLFSAGRLSAPIHKAMVCLTRGHNLGVRYHCSLTLISSPLPP